VAKNSKKYPNEKIFFENKKAALSRLSKDG